MLERPHFSHFVTSPRRQLIHRTALVSQIPHGRVSNRAMLFVAMSEMFREVSRQLGVAQDKYTYFLLAAAGTAIGFAVNQTHDAVMSRSQIPLAGAVLCWGLSFYFGCRHLAYVNSSLYSNAELLKIEAGHHPEIGTHVQLMAAASQGIRSALESNANRANRLGHMQFRFLIAGAVLYIGWHVLEMWLRTRA